MIAMLAGRFASLRRGLGRGLTVEMTTARMMLAIMIKAAPLKRTIRVNRRRRLMLTPQRSCVSG